MTAPSSSGTTSFSRWVKRYEASLDDEGRAELDVAREEAQRRRDERDDDDQDEAMVPA